jgi:hypothetical protein
MRSSWILFQKTSIFIVTTVKTSSYKKCITLCSHACYMPWPSKWTHACWEVQAMKILVLKCSPISCYFIPPESKCSLQHPVLSNTPSLWRMSSSGMLRRVALARTHVSDELSASFIRVTRTGELGTTLSLTGNRRTLRRNFFAVN